MRKTPIDKTEKTPETFKKYSKDNTEKDLYPWLDKNGPRRHMTGQGNA